MNPVLTAVVGTNDQLIAEVARLYLKPEMSVADVTFGRGVFWKSMKLNIAPKRFFPSDINPQEPYVHKADFRKLPHAGGSMNVVVFDPPYMHGGATVKRSLSKCYGNKTTKYASHEKILLLYADGMKEARRILKPDGTLWVKCQDEIESGKQRWSHMEIFQLACARNWKR